MTNEPLYSLKEAASKLGGYPLLLRNLIYRHKVPHRVVGGLIILDDAGLATLAPLVEAWKNRPRVTRPAAASA